jgi:hypothetical protein
MSAVQDNVVRRVLEERRAQIAEWGIAHDLGHDLGEWINLVMVQLGELAVVAVTGQGDVSRARISQKFINSAALCIAAVESLDRLEQARRRYAGPAAVTNDEVMLPNGEMVSLGTADEL